MGVRERGVARGPRRGAELRPKAEMQVQGNGAETSILFDEREMGTIRPCAG